MKNLRWGLIPALLVLMSMPLAASASSPAPSPEPTSTAVAPEAPLQVTVTELLPRAPRPQDAVEVLGRLQNVGSTAITNIQVRLRIGSPVRTRGGLHDADIERPTTQSRAATSTVPAAAELAPGAVTTFAIHTTVRLLGLSQLGVYPLDVEARGNAGDRFEALGLAPTWLPFFAGLSVQPTRVAVIWPLVDRPRQSAAGAFTDDDLATALSGNGRLGRLLAAGDTVATPQCDRALTPPRPPAKPPAPARCERVYVTYAVDPDLLRAAQALSGVHDVTSNGKTASHQGVAAAASWLAGLSRSAARNGLIALPYGDPDVTAMTRGTDASLRDDLAFDAGLSRAAVADTLHVTALENVAWPPAGVVTSAAADLLSRQGARALVLDPSAYDQADADTRRAPSARTLLPSTTNANLEGLVADPYLSDLVTGAMAAEFGPRVAEQRFLAETAIVAAEAPSLSRTLVIAPERRGDVNTSAAAAALRDLGRVPWLCPVSLTSVADGNERCAGRPDVASPVAQDRGPLRTSLDDDLSASYLKRVAQQRARAVQLGDAVLTDRADPKVTALRADLRRAVARAESSAWRDDAPGANAAISQLRNDLDELIGKVRMRGGQVLLTSTSGEIQVSVDNVLPVPITVRVRFQSRTPGLLTATSELVEVAPGHSVQARSRATAQRSGQFIVDAHLVDRNGDDFGSQATVNLRSTQYGRLALALTVGAAGLLLIAAAVRLIRRARRRTT